MTFLFAYLLTPNRTISLMGHKLPFVEGFLIMYMTSWVIISHFGLTHPIALFTASTSMTIFMFLSLVTYCAIIDLLAQTFNSPSKLMLLISWQGLTVMPFLLFSPLTLIAIHFSETFSWVISTVKLLLIFSIIFLQIRTIQHLYRFSLGRTIWMYAVPILGLFLFVSCASVLLGFSLFQS